MKILITGGAGFIGSHTCDALLAAGHEVRVVDNLQKPVHLKGKPVYISDAVEFLYGDVRDKNLMEYALHGMDVVFHFAAYQDYLPDFSTYFSVNSVSTALLYEIIVEKELPIKKVIVAASQAVLGEGLYRCESHGEIVPNIRLERQLAAGDWEHHCPKCGEYMQYQATPEHRMNPQNQYALSKQSEEAIAINLGRRYQIPSVAMRYSIVQGSRQSFYNAYSGAMRIFALHLYFDKSPIIYEDGRQVRDYVNIHDVVKANLLVMESDDANYRVFNVGGGKAYTVNEFYDILQKITGKSQKPVIGNYYRYGDTRHILSDISALRALGWRPTNGIENSIDEYWTYLKEQTDIDDILEYSEQRMKSLNVVRSVNSRNQ